MITQALFSMVTGNGRDVNCHRTNWPQSSNIKLHQSRHPLSPQVHLRPGETAAGRLVSKLGLAQGTGLGWMGASFHDNSSVDTHWIADPGWD